MNKFAVFDIDGTLIRWQLYHAIVDKLASKKLLGENAKKKLHDARMVWKRREHPDSFHGYERALIEVYEAALPNLTTEQFDVVVDQVATEYKDQVYTYTRDLARTLHKNKYKLIAISGSHEELVGKVASHYNFDYWVGTKYKRLDGKFTGQKYVASKDKRIILENLISRHNLSFSGSVGIGDSLNDASFLEIVKKPIVFNPDIKLLDIAKSKGWKIVIERKNVVYELESTDGQYKLV